MKILLIGGNGFIGSYLAQTLSAYGHAVLVLDRYPTPRWGERLKDVVYIEADWTQKEPLGACFSEHKPEMVIHLASNLLPGSPKAELLFAAELRAQKQLFKLLKKHSIPKLIYFSSGGTVYGENGLSIHSEQDTPRPISLYGSLKLETESLILRAHDTWGLEYLIVRPSNAYGPGQSLTNIQGLIAVALGCVLEHKPLTVWGDGSDVRDYLYIDDLVEAVYRLIHNGITNEIVNIGTKKGYSVKKVIKVIERVSQSTIPIDYQPKRQVDVAKNVLDTRKIRALIRWQPRVSLKKGISLFWHTIQ